MAKMTLTKARLIQSTPAMFKRLMDRMIEAQNNECAYAWLHASSTVTRHAPLPPETWPALNAALAEYYRQKILALLDDLDKLEIDTQEEREALAESEIPNAETVAAIEAGERGETTKCSSVEEVMAKLKAPEDDLQLPEISDPPPRPVDL